MAQELRSFLDENELRETKCLVCLPSNLVLATSIEIPELSEEDRQSYLELQAETEFPFSADEVNLASIPYQAPDHTHHATLAAVAKSQIHRIERILGHAKLRPLSFTLGLGSGSSTSATPSQEAHLLLNVFSDHVDLAVQCAEGFAAIRSLDEVYESDGDQQVLDHELLRREIKITLGQLSPAIRAQLKQATVSLQENVSGNLSETIKSTLKDLGFTATSSPAEHSTLTQAGTAYIQHQRSLLEFLPPKETQFQAFTKKVSSRSNAWVGGTVGTIAVLTFIAFYYQGYRLRSLESEWSGMADKVEELETLQGKIRQFRPWFTRSAESLAIAKQLSDAFPREGTIWVKSVQIKENARVYCSGSARNNQELLSVMDQLREMEHVSDVTLQQVRGEAPVQFGFNFQWKAGG